MKTALKERYPYYLANRPVAANEDLEVTDKYSGKVVTRVALADADVIEKAIEAAVEATEPMRKLAPFERKEVLLHCVKRFEERAEELADVLRIEAGKPIKDSRGEVTRLIETFQIAAEEAVRDHQGEVLNLEISERSKGYRGMYKRVPIGPCSFISPFNFPLNLTAHKVAPAIAAGCPFVLKPASRTPLGALMIGEILAETDLPKGAFSILPCSRDGADLFTEDERLKLLSFTGSPDVGWKLKSKAGKKKVVLELGGNAACIIDKGADLEDAVSRVVTGAFYQSGQSCISVQRLLVHEEEREAFVSKLLSATKQLKSGDPADEDVFVGPMIAESEAERLENWIQKAKEAGGKILCGGGRDGAVVEPTLMTNVPKDQPLQAEEAFGPVVVIDTFSDFDEALRETNDSRYGIHAGVFTPSLDHAMKAWDELEVGGVLINEMPSWRVDNLPYGGVKDSGLGREGLRYAIEDMTEIRTLVIRSA
ncbi:aldehyde dehydrogenase family protein [Pelagicoccus sp. SDUM812003]|uniref:aldehyde dehydrogenase family protein n=1 Tax=Pelagicoccus sp. SDUM812003 TaxID=3041267 RepID=UPI00280D65DE|nr:aldehyde dehydrogenase family protein [Pelagicoccus sp. SDUM812003]MDQ8205281.1 aldehyde dehydrogenase family protein [Pelagicoccus sp. SDUM812003]